MYLHNKNYASKKQKIVKLCIMQWFFGMKTKTKKQFRLKSTSYLEPQYIVIIII